MKGQRPNWLRRSYLINRRFQWTFIGFTLITALLNIGIVYGSNSYFFGTMAATARDKGLSPDDIFFRFIDQQQQIMEQVLIFTGVGIGTVLCVFGVLFSHRVAGPIYRLTKHLNAMADGAAPTPLRFRDGDFFPEVAEALNRHLAAAKEREHKGPSSRSVS